MIDPVVPTEVLSIWTTNLFTWLCAKNHVFSGRFNWDKSRWQFIAGFQPTTKAVNGKKEIYSIMPTRQVLQFIQFLKKLRQALKTTVRKEKKLWLWHKEE